MRSFAITRDVPSTRVNPRKLTLIAVETRYRSVIMMSGGLIRDWASMIREANGSNFASHIRAPKLMIHGRYDEANPYKTVAQPLYRLLREPKKLVLLDYGHVPSLDVSVRIINTWLDTHLSQTYFGNELGQVSSNPSDVFIKVNGQITDHLCSSVRNL